MKATKPRILLTGDDGYFSIGTRLLIHFLKNDFELAVGGTNTQQSGMGGRLSLNGGAYGEALVDGIPAVWVDGSPVDAVGAAHKHFGGPFDYVISGINLGANIGGANISSGTFSAVFRALNAGITNQGIALSWDVTPEFWVRNHSRDEDLTKYIEHPGKNAFQVIKMTLENNLWGSKLININIPQNQASEVRFTKPIANAEEFYAPLALDPITQEFFYPMQIMDIVNTVPGTDLHVLQQGQISISPCRTDFMDMELYQKIKDRELQLESLPLLSPEPDES